MSWYDPFKLKSRKWSERSPTGKKIYVFYYFILTIVLATMVWIGEFSDEAKIRQKQEINEWREANRTKTSKAPLSDLDNQ